MYIALSWSHTTHGSQVTGSYPPLPESLLVKDTLYTSSAKQHLSRLHPWLCPAVWLGKDQWPVTLWNSGPNRTEKRKWLSCVGSGPGSLQGSSACTAGWIAWAFQIFWIGRPPSQHQNHSSNNFSILLDALPLDLTLMIWTQNKASLLCLSWLSICWCPWRK